MPLPPGAVPGGEEGELSDAGAVGAHRRGAQGRAAAPAPQQGHVEAGVVAVGAGGRAADEVGEVGARFEEDGGKGGA